jgi:hypothetical protein
MVRILRGPAMDCSGLMMMMMMVYLPHTYLPLASRVIFSCWNIHTYHSRFIPEGVAAPHLRYSFRTPTFYQYYLAMRNTADVIGGKPIAVWTQSISRVAINPLVAFYDIHRRKGEMLFLSRTPHETILKHDITQFA